MEEAQIGLEGYLLDTLVNKLIESKIPKSCRSNTCIIGIDEAGRGPVLGPMVYAAAYYPKKHEDVLAKMKFADSKELTEANREKLFDALQTNQEGFSDIGYFIKIISPNMISNSMLRRNKYNLNALSHDTAIDLIRRAESSGIKIEHIYIDTVGPAIAYREKLIKFFPQYKHNITVAERADSKYPIVSAASICAKVPRDRIVKNWRFAESEKLYLDAFELGSGYPADPGTKLFLERSIDPVFGYSTLARFSWSTITKALEKGACVCDYNEPDDEQANPKTLMKQQAMFKSFFVKKKPESKAVARVRDGADSTKTIGVTRTTADKFFDDRCLFRVLVW